jgi:hypothetical protein
MQARHRKTSPFEDAQEFDADRATRADNRNVITFHQQPDSIAGRI